MKCRVFIFHPHPKILGGAEFNPPPPKKKKASANDLPKEEI